MNEFRTFWLIYISYDATLRNFLSKGVKTFKWLSIYTDHQKAIKLVVNDKMRSRLTDSNGNISIVNQIAAGATAGACQCVITSPMEMFKIAGQTGIPLKTIWDER